MKKIKLSSGNLSLVDDEDYIKYGSLKWGNGGGYATRYELLGYYPSGKRKAGTILMHRLIMNAPKGIEVDHINGNRLDNRKSNLRLCTHEQNMMNRRISKSNSSGYTGVSKFGKYGWRAMIGVNSKNESLGVFKNKDDAARAYNEAAIKYRGEFTKLNVIP